MDKKEIENLGLYFITDSTITKTPVISQVKQAIDGGIKIIQYREKNLPTLEMYNQAKEIRKLTKNKAIFVVNDRIDICLAVNADGVHLGKDDIPYSEARKLLKDKIIGLSTHNIQEALHAEKLGADYISIGPIFATNTKPNHQKPVGIKTIKELSKKIKFPFVAIGGINGNNIKDVVNAGAKNVAMISALVTKKDIANEIKKFIGYFT